MAGPQYEEGEALRQGNDQGLYQIFLRYASGLREVTYILECLLVDAHTSVEGRRCGGGGNLAESFSFVPVPNLHLHAPPP